MSKLADVALGKIEELEKQVSEIKAKLVKREAQLALAQEALTAIREHARLSSELALGQIASAALARLPEAASLLGEMREAIRIQTAQECVALIYPDGNPEIAIRRIQQDFGLTTVPAKN